MYGYMQNENLALMEQMIEQNYGNVPRAPGEVKDLAKIDAPMLSSTSGFFNTQFGASVFRQLNESSTLFGVLPKFAYRRGGYRAQTTRFLNSGVGIAENGSIADTIKPTQVQVTVGIKEQHIALEYSERMRLLAQTQDDVGFDVASLLQRAKDSFVYALDQDLNTDATTLASTNIESIDRIVSSYAEVANCSDINANDVDIYGLDRDAGATWTDAYVNHNSGTARPLTDKIIKAIISNTVSAGANPRYQVWYTGEDTYTQITALYQTQVRYDGAKPFSAITNVNDGQTGGVNMGLEAGSLYGRPIFVAPTGKVVANGNISNLYLLDLSYDPLYNEPILGIKVLQAPIVAETKLVTYPAHGKLGNKHILYSAMELECKRFNVQGKARDLDVVS